MAKQYWLMKSEPDVFGINDLEKKKKEIWDGVRNYQARNFMRDKMSVGDEVLFYHSRVAPVGVFGIAKVSRIQVIDPTQFDKKSKYYDAKSTKEAPRWICVEVEFVRKLNSPIELSAIKSNKKLKNMPLVQPGQRLSVQPVSVTEFKEVLKMEPKT